MRMLEIGILFSFSFGLKMLINNTFSEFYTDYSKKRQICRENEKEMLGTETQTIPGNL